MAELHFVTNRKEVVQFKRKIAAGETITLRERIKASGTIESLYVRFYPGQELSLQVRPYVEHKGQKIEQLITYVEGGDQFLSGDDDQMTLATIVTVENDDWLKVAVTNSSDAYPYTLNVSVTIDYYAGTDRVVGVCSVAREEFSSSVVVQRTIGSQIKAINDINVTTVEQTIPFAVNLINYLTNKGSVELTVKFVKGGQVIGTKVMAAGYGFNDAYIQIDSIKVSVATGATTLDGMGVA